MPSQERESLNANIVHSINQASDEWGIRCLRYEIKDIHVPPRVKESMQMQVSRRAWGRPGLVDKPAERVLVLGPAGGGRTQEESHGAGV